MQEQARRLAAIMLTDIVSYTALTQSNESLALELLEGHRDLLRPIFSKHGGREIKTLGDSFLVAFDSALNATFCACEIQVSLHGHKFTEEDRWRIKLRIGIHLGDVVERQGDILGDAVNIASRIEPLADPEGICISQQVYDQVENKLTYQLRGLLPTQLKNVSLPVRVYKIVMPWEEKNESREVQGPSTSRAEVAIMAIKDGPFLVLVDGMVNAALCRCGQSNEQPYCDGTHKKIGFTAKPQELRVI